MGMEEMMAQMMGHKSGATENLIGEKLIPYREKFQPIQGLKAGDKVRWKSSEFQDKKTPEPLDIVEVFRVFPEPKHAVVKGSNHDADELDFSILTIEHGEETVCEYLLDSRRFERVE